MSSNVDTVMRVRTSLEIGLAIKERRLERGLDQAELAERVGVSRQWLVEIEKGKPRAEIGLVLRVLRELGLDIWLGDVPSTNTVAASTIDLNRIIERAKGSPDGS